MFIRPDRSLRVSHPLLTQPLTDPVVPDALYR